ncbi:Angiomotin-like 2a [Larimichthys crocea]|uniref:Uncharacterized protein n=1 Tax=Larimichthys crocea TaxID=215358 RepID=A0ACD3RKN9_LARCR|nr:Angiomotin-like 2a [Larimichthys crocea]
MDIMGSRSEGQWDLKREHARSLSERLLQLSLERNGPRQSLAMSSSHSYPQLYNNNNVTNAVAPEKQGAQQCVDQRGPPPDYPIFARLPEYMVSHSQEHGQYCRDPPPPFYSQHHSRYVSAQSQVAHNNITAAFSNNSAQTDVLMRENERLRKELEVYAEKAARLQKLELEIQRISEAYETLMKGSAKRETLEKTMRNKLEAEIKRMHDFNRDLREQLDTATRQRVAKEAECSDQRQHVFVKLLEQNEEQQREREQLERQIQHLRVSGDECQRRRELVEKALASTQARNRQLEEELQRKRAYVEKVERLQSALAQLQAACEKRETLELRLRTRLEQELKSLRAQQSQNQSADPTASELSSSTLQQQLREKEERILALEADITKWEQKYLEESTMRQFAMDAAATAAAQRYDEGLRNITKILKNKNRDNGMVFNSHIFSFAETQPSSIIHHGHSPNSSFNEDLPLSSHRHQEMENSAPDGSRANWRNRGFVSRGPSQSINTVAGSTESKGKNLSDDQTGAAAAALQPRPRVVPQSSSRDCSTQCDEAPQEPELTAEPGKLKTAEAATTDTSEEPKAPLKTFKSINGSDAEVVEILI